MFPRETPAQTRDLAGKGSLSKRRRGAMTKLAARRRAPGLARIESSRATPRVDGEDVWVIPCITVRKAARGRGIALALIRAAVRYAVRHGAPAVEAYPRAGDARTADDNAYFGTEPLFRRAGFRVMRTPPASRARNRVARVTMRIACRPKGGG